MQSKVSVEPAFTTQTLLLETKALLQRHHFRGAVFGEGNLNRAQLSYITQVVIIKIYFTKGYYAQLKCSFYQGTKVSEVLKSIDPLIGDGLLPGRKVGTVTVECNRPYTFQDRISRQLDLWFSKGFTF